MIKPLSELGTKRVGMVVMTVEVNSIILLTNKRVCGPYHPRGIWNQEREDVLKKDLDF